MPDIAESAIRAGRTCSFLAIAARRIGRKSLTWLIWMRGHGPCPIGACAHRLDRLPPERDVLRRVTAEHFETFHARTSARRDGERLPRFVEREFCRYVTCGALAGGFARFRCAGCGSERLVAFTGKGRGFCPSCGGRRMVERAAHLVDRVLPAVPIRQWVLTMPPRVPYLLAWNHALTRAVTAVYLRAVMSWLRRRSGRRGARVGAVAIIQRFGGALNLNCRERYLA